MAPYELKKMTLQQLRKAFLAMLTPEWDIALVGKPQAEITKAAKALLTLQRFRLRLENKGLKEIRDNLLKNKEALLKSSESLEKALKNLKRVEDVIVAVNKIIKVVGKII